MPRKKAPPSSSVSLPKKRSADTAKLAESGQYSFPLCCPYPLCYHHARPFKRSQDYLRHLTTTGCISKHQSYVAQCLTASSSNIEPSTALDTCEVHVNNIRSDANNTNVAQYNVLHPSMYAENTAGSAELLLNNDTLVYDADNEDNTASASVTTYTTQQKCVVSLMHLLDSMNAPDYALEPVLMWARNAHAEHFNFNPPALTRNANLKWMRQFVKGSNMLLPKLQQVQHALSPTQASANQDPCLPTIWSLICHLVDPQLEPP